MVPNVALMISCDPEAASLESATQDMDYYIQPLARTSLAMPPLAL